MTIFSAYGYKTRVHGYYSPATASTFRFLFTTQVVGETCYATEDLRVIMPRNTYIGTVERQALHQERLKNHELLAFCVSCETLNQYNSVRENAGGLVCLVCNEKGDAQSLEGV